jgi:hypothetical protein
MMIAEVDGSGTTIVRYPVAFDDVKKATPLTGWPENPAAATFQGSGYRIVEETDPPEPAFGETVQETAPVLSGGVWRRQWTKTRVTLAQAKQQLAQMVVDIYWERLMAPPAVAEFQAAGRSGIAVLQGRTTRFQPAVNDVSTRIQAATDIDAAYAIYRELEALS